MLSAIGRHTPRRRGIQYSAPPRVNRRLHGVLDRPPSRTMAALGAVRTVLLILLVGFVLPAFAQVAVPPLTGRVVDQTATLSSGDIASLTQTLKDLETRKGSQVAVLIVPTTDGEAIEQFSLRVAEAWKIGRRKVDDGALLVIAKNDRHLRIEVGYGLEGALTDVTTKRIIDEDITPKFKSGDFAGGIDAGVNRIVKVIEGEKLPAPEPEHWQNPNLSGFIDPLNPVVIIGLLIVGGVLRAILGRLVGSAATAGVVGVFVWVAAGSLVAAALLAVIAFVISLSADGWSSVNPGMGRGGSRRGSSFPGGGWSGGGGGWSGGSGGGSGGGFSGGGGSFGGGGASGSW